jgi:hypothetical protein
VHASHNKSAQPMPGARLCFNRAPLARHGWPHRWATSLVVKTFAMIQLLLLAGCASHPREMTVAPLDAPTSQAKTRTVSFAANAWIRGVTSEDIKYVKSALSQTTRCPIDGPIISLGKGPTAEGEHMIAYTSNYYYEFVRRPGVPWRLLRCEAYAADSTATR